MSCATAGRPGARFTKLGVRRGCVWCRRDAWTIAFDAKPHRALARWRQRRGNGQRPLTGAWRKRHRSLRRSSRRHPAPGRLPGLLPIAPRGRPFASCSVQGRSLTQSSILSRIRARATASCLSVSASRGTEKLQASPRAANELHFAEVLLAGCRTFRALVGHSIAMELPNPWILLCSRGVLAWVARFGCVEAGCRCWRKEVLHLPPAEAGACVAVGFGPALVRWCTPAPVARLPTAIAVVSVARCLWIPRGDSHPMSAWAQGWGLLDVCSGRSARRRSQRNSHRERRGPPLAETRSDHD